MENLENLVDQIIAGAGLNKMPDDFKEMFKGEMLKEMVNRMGVVALEAIPEGERQAALDYVEENKDKPAKINNYFRVKIPNFDEVMQKGMEEFAEEAIASAKGK